MFPDASKLNIISHCSLQLCHCSLRNGQWHNEHWHNCSLHNKAVLCNPYTGLYGFAIGVPTATYSACWQLAQGPGVSKAQQRLTREAQLLQAFHLRPQLQNLLVGCIRMLPVMRNHRRQQKKRWALVEGKRKAFRCRGAARNPATSTAARAGWWPPAAVQTPDHANAAFPV